jgi:hypothetical protein
VNILGILIALVLIPHVDLIALRYLGEYDLVAASFEHVVLLRNGYLWKELVL